MSTRARLGGSKWMAKAREASGGGTPVTESVADYRDTIHPAIRATTKLSIPL